ncbi:hypothetical protein [uncultured Roseibium sp.]|uniref:hypothetical protein n=1 Tax=uncultured Roseibium sp. TaxID=1936171 RepID=UPI003217D37F
MVLRAALNWTKSDTVEIRDLDILRPLVIDSGETWETEVRISPDDRVVEIYSRPRLQDSDWSLNAPRPFRDAVGNRPYALAAPPANRKPPGWITTRFTRSPVPSGWNMVLCSGGRTM